MKFVYFKKKKKEKKRKEKWGFRKIKDVEGRVVKN